MIAKINILNNTEDKAYKLTKNTLSMNDPKTYTSYLNEIRRKSMEIKDVREKYSWVLRISNCSNIRINSNSITNSISNQTKDQKYDENKLKKSYHVKNGIG